MKTLRNFKNLSLKKALMKSNFPKSKSVKYKDKSIANIEQNNKFNCIYNTNNLTRKNIKEKNNNLESNDSLDIKNESNIIDKIYKANQLKIKENEIEDEEINSLNDQIRKIMLKNLEMQTKIEKQLNMRYFYEKNQKSIAAFVNDLNFKFRNYDQTISQYEASILKMKKDNRKLQNDYDKKIEDIELENEKLKKRIRDRVELYMHQKGKIDEKTVKTQNLENEIQNQKNMIKERVDMNKKKVNELEKKYDKIYKKIIEIEVNCEDKVIQKMMQNNLYTIEENKTKNKKGKKEKDEIKELHKKIEDCELNNDELLNELKELNKQYEELTKNKDAKDNTNSNSKEKKQRLSVASTMKSSVSNYIRDTISENKFK